MRDEANWCYLNGMTVQQLKEAWAAKPFIPFRIIFPGGTADVPHPEFISFSQTGRIASVSLPDDRFLKVDVALITALEELEAAPH